MNFTSRGQGLEVQSMTALLCVDSTISPRLSGLVDPPPPLKSRITRHIAH